MRLDNAARELERAEAGIINAIVERAQIGRNSSLYTAGTDEEAPLQKWLKNSEKQEALHDAFLFQEIKPFYRHFDSTSSEPSTGSNKNIDINLNAEIYQAYIGFLPRFTPAGDDGRYSEALRCDTCVLKLVSRRVHMGSYLVGESKFQNASASLQDAVRNSDDSEIEKHITRAKVENMILKRVRRKTRRIQAGSGYRVFVHPNEIVVFYKEIIIPLTKAGEVAYLKRR